MIFRLLLACTLIAVGAGCTTVHKDFKPYAPSSGGQVGKPGATAVVLPESLCAFHYDNGNLTAFDIGPVICRNARLAAAAAFADPRFYSRLDEVNPREVDAVISLRPGDANTYGTRQIPATVSAEADLLWTYRTGGGESYGARIYGYGEDTRTFGLADTRYTAVMQRCMDDLASNLQKEMAAAPEKLKRNLASTQAIRQRIAGLAIGSSLFAEYNRQPVEGLRIYAIDEQVKYKGGQYQYLNDQAAGRHDASLGSCVTHWVKPWPVIEALRPSVYLPREGTGDEVPQAFHLVERIGSVYDNHPLCELGFDGDTIETARLSSLDCTLAQLPESPYPSIGSGNAFELNETAQQWLQLRIGMTRGEVVSLLGLPPRMGYSTFTNAWNFEYGHGRLSLDSGERLLRWQLRQYPTPLEQMRGDVEKSLSGCLLN